MPGKRPHPPLRNRHVPCTADMEHYLADEPVQACPPTKLYRFRKFARRNKTGLVIASVVGLAFLLMIVGAGWMLRDYATRQAILDQKITQALDEAKTWHDSHKLTEAMSAIDRAEGFLASGGGNDALQQEIQQWRNDIATVQRLDQIRLDMATDFSDSSKFSSNADNTYAECFQRYGIDLAALPEEKSAQLIRSSRIRDDLIAALDMWASFGSLFSLSETMIRPNDKALKIARLVDRDPWRDRVRSAVEQGDEAALLQLAAEQEMSGRTPGTVLLLAQGIRERSNCQAAIELLKPFQRQHPNEFWINIELDTNLMNVKPLRADEAIGYARAAFALRPDSASACNKLALALKGHGDFAEAEEAFRESIRLNSNFWLGYRNLMILLKKEGKDADADVLFQSIVMRKLDHAEDYADVAYMAIQVGKDAEAEKAMREAIRLKPDYALAHNILGYALAEQGKHADAEPEYREAIRLKPDLEVAYYSLGATLGKLGKYAEAEAADREAIRLAPNDPNGHINLGGALSAKANMRKPRSSIEKPFAFRQIWSSLM